MYLTTHTLFQAFLAKKSVHHELHPSLELARGVFQTFSSGKWVGKWVDHWEINVSVPPIILTWAKI